MPYIGNQPFGKTVRTVTTETITSVKTAYYPNGGYMAGYVDVYVNGVRLSESLDFTATDGSLVTLLYSPSIGDTVEIVTYGSVEIANAVRRSGDTFSGNVYVGSNVYISTSTISVGNATVNTQITAGNIALNGSTLTIGNSTVNTVFTGDTVTVGGTLSLGNTSITGTANVTTAINVGANVSMNTTSIRVGNSTVNTYIVSDTIYGPSTLYIDPAAAGDNTGLVIVKGDLQVDGTTFTINSANVTVNDKNVVLASGAINNAATDGAGLTIFGTNANLTYNATGNNFEMSRGLSITGTANVSVGLNVGANVNLSTSQINVGNSTVNTVISAASLTTTSNTVSLGTAAYVVSNGNVGIATNSPATKLHVSGGTIRNSGTNGVLQLMDGNVTGGVKIASYNPAASADGYLAFEGYTIEYGRFNSSGNLGIGTSSPEDRLHAVAAVAAGLSLQASGTGGSTWRILSTDNAASLGGGYLGFNNGSYRMVLDSSGNLGLGTTSPYSAAGYSSLTLNNTTGSQIRMRSSGTDIGLIFNTASSFNVYTSGAIPLVLSTNDTERARIDSSGNLGLGTTTPSTGKFSDASYAFLIQSASTSTGTNIFASNSDNSKFVGFWSGHSGAEPAVGVKTGNAFTFGKWAAINGTGGFTENMRIDSSGNLSIGGFSPNAWSTGYRAINLFSSNSLGLAGSDYGSQLTNNCYYSAANEWTRVGASYGAGRYEQFNGYHAWYGNAAGAAGAFTPTFNMILSTAGYLGIGTSNPSEKIHVYGTAASGSNQGPRINLQYSGTSGAAESLINFLDFRGAVNAAIGNNLQDDGVGTAAAHMVFKTAVSGTLYERMRLDTSGQLQFPLTSHGTAQISNVYSLNVASGGTVDFANFSGMIIVNNWNQGSVSLWIAGGGTYTLVAGIAAYYGSLSFTSGFYRWTSNAPSTMTYTFTAIRTRTNA